MIRDNFHLRRCRRWHFNEVAATKLNGICLLGRINGLSRHNFILHINREFMYCDGDRKQSEKVAVQRWVCLIVLTRRKKIYDPPMQENLILVFLINVKYCDICSISDFRILITELATTRQSFNMCFSCCCFIPFFIKQL